MNESIYILLNKLLYETIYELLNRLLYEILYQLLSKYIDIVFTMYINHKKKYWYFTYSLRFKSHYVQLCKYVTFVFPYNTNKPVFTHVYVHINEDIPVHISSWSCFYTLISLYLYTPVLVHVPDYILTPEHTFTPEHELKRNNKLSPSPI